jgi:hypothetical protein
VHAVWQSMKVTMLEKFKGCGDPANLGQQRAWLALHEGKTVRAVFRTREQMAEIASLYPLCDSEAFWLVHPEDSQALHAQGEANTYLCDHFLEHD